LPEPGHEREPVHLRHAHVENGHVEAARCRGVESRTGKPAGAHLVLGREDALDRPQHPGLVVDHEDFRARHQSLTASSRTADRRAVTRVPAPTRLSMARLPPASAAIDRHVERPSPVPCSLVVKKGDSIWAKVSEVIPMPSSDTVISTKGAAIRAATVSVPPFGRAS